MIKGSAAILFYEAYDAATGLRKPGDAAQHTVFYSAGGGLEPLSVVPEELSSSGVYTFTLPAEYTWKDTAVCLIISASVDIVIPLITLSFEEQSERVPDITALCAELPARTAEAVHARTLSSGQSLAEAVTGVSTKLASYPAGDDIACKRDIPTVESLSEALLITDVGALTPAAYSLGSMVLAGFCSTMDPQTGIWEIRKPNGTLVASRRFLTSDKLAPVVEVY